MINTYNIYNTYFISIYTCIKLILILPINLKYDVINGWSKKIILSTLVKMLTTENMIAKEWIPCNSSHNLFSDFSPHILPTLDNQITSINTNNTLIPIN